MITILKLILFTSMVVISWKIATSEGMLLDKIGQWASSKRESGKKIFEILICPFCAPSLFSIFGYGFGYLSGIEFTWKIFICYPLVVFGASTLSGFIWYLWLLLESAQGYYSNMEQLTHFEIKNKKQEHYNKTIRK